MANQAAAHTAFERGESLIELKPEHLDTLAPTQRIRVLCIDDSRDLTDALSRLIAMQPDMENAGVLHAADMLVDEVVQRRVVVVVIDLTMPGADPLTAIRELSQSVPTCRVIAFSGYDDAETRIAAKRAGVTELVSKIAVGGALLQAIRRVAAGIPRPAMTSTAETSAAETSAAEPR